MDRSQSALSLPGFRRQASSTLIVLRPRRGGWPAIAAGIVPLVVLKKIGNQEYFYKPRPNFMFGR
jgi:hypothetical protein